MGGFVGLLIHGTGKDFDLEWAAGDFCELTALIPVRFHVPPTYPFCSPTNPLELLPTPVLLTRALPVNGITPNWAVP
jgi:hypothetical protein